LLEIVQVHLGSHWQATWYCRNVGLDRLGPHLTLAPCIPRPETMSH